jgi:hypothetical protein
LWLIVPLVGFAAVIGQRAELCSCVGAFLISTALFARWRGRAVGDAMTHGVLVGSFVTITGLGMGALLMECAAESLASLCGLLCVCSGLIGGYALFRLSANVDTSWTGKHWSIAVGAIAVTALLGCSDLSRSQLSLLAAGLLAASLAGFLVRRSRHFATTS